jgi:hypothetical protein
MFQITFRFNGIRPNPILASRRMVAKKEELSFIFGQIVMSVMSQISISIHSSSMATESKEP